MRNALWLLALVACSDDESNPYALRRDSNAVVAPGEVYRACSVATDCVLVNVTCNGCCTEAAISKGLSTRFQEELESACSGYQGAICDCSRADISSACVNGACVEVPNP